MISEAALATSFKALSHPRRARIFRILAENPDAGKSFLILLQASRLPKTPFEHHLRQMERCGLVRRRQRGNRVEYSLTPSRFSRALGEVAGLIATRPTQRAA